MRIGDELLNSGNGMAWQPPSVALPHAPAVQSMAIEASIVDAAMLFCQLRGAQMLKSSSLSYSAASNNEFRMPVLKPFGR